MSTSPTDGRVAARVRDWHHARQAAECDVLEPWAHGTVVRATRYPSYFDFNVVRVEDDPAMSVDALVAFADEALAGLAHRRVDFDLIEAAELLRAGFEGEGWRPLRLVWMHHETAPPRGLEARVEDVPYDAVHDLASRRRAGLGNRKRRAARSPESAVHTRRHDRE